MPVKQTIKLNKQDLAEIVANRFNVPVDAVEMTVEGESYGHGVYEEYRQVPVAKIVTDVEIDDNERRG